jgi:hypothetical protein
MQKKKKAKEKNSFRRKERSVFKKSLTGPTLLEMPDYCCAITLANRLTGFTVL